MLGSRLYLRAVGQRDTDCLSARVRFVCLNPLPACPPLFMRKREHLNRQSLFNNPTDGKQADIRSHYCIVAQTHKNVPSLARYLPPYGSAEAHPPRRVVEAGLGVLIIHQLEAIAPPLLIPGREDQPAALDAIANREILRVGGAEPPGLRMSDPAPGGPHDRDQAALPVPGRDVDHQVADLAPVHRLQVRADGGDVETVDERVGVHMLPRLAHELKQAPPREFRFDRLQERRQIRQGDCGLPGAAR